MSRITRVPGGYTAMHWQGEVIAWADTISTTSVTPVVAAQPIQPMNYLRPAEIVTPRAHTYGTITLLLTERVNEAVWQRLGVGFSDNPGKGSFYRARDIMDIFAIQAAMDNGIQITEFFHSNKLNADGTPTVKYQETFYNVTVVEVGDNENVRIDTLIQNKPITCWFTHSQKTYPGINQNSRPIAIS